MRLRLVRAIHARPHRYARYRWLTQGITFAILYGVPLAGLARFDLWNGRHLALRRPVGPVYGIAAVLVGILAFYLATFTLNAIMGRVFCGFGCPIGQVSRLGDDAEIGGKTLRERAAAALPAAAFSLALAVAIALWFVSPRVVVEGSPLAALATAAGVLALAALVYLHGRYFRWRFCEGYCPIGVYYSAVVTDHAFGIHFDAARNTCKECSSCSLVCPVGLDPRDLAKPKDGLPGIGIDGFPGANHCLDCGECVRACELQFVKDGLALVPLRLSFHDAPDGAAAAPAPDSRGVRASSEPPIAFASPRRASSTSRASSSMSAMRDVSCRGSTRSRGVRLASPEDVGARILSARSALSPSSARPRGPGRGR